MKSYCIRVCDNSFICKSSYNEDCVAKYWNEMQRYVSNLVLVKAKCRQTAIKRALLFGYAEWKYCGGRATDARIDCIKLQKNKKRS